MGWGRAVVRVRVYERRRSVDGRNIAVLYGAKEWLLVIAG